VNEKSPYCLRFVFADTIFACAKKIAADKYTAVDQLALRLPDSLTKNTEGIASYINANFTDTKDKARAIFIWLASNITYDLENMFAIDFYEKKEEKIGKALKTRKGICESYAALFNDIAAKTGIRSYVIEGYTKQNGFTDYIPHAWCAALVDGSWWLFDPTWGSGFVTNGSFTKKINNSYFMANPAVLISSHMPFDPLWQFSYYPVSSQEFYDGKTARNKEKPFFNFLDSIPAYERLPYLEQLAASAGRIEKNGIRNSLTFDRLRHIKMEIEQYKRNDLVDLYNSAAYDLNEGVNRYNVFIEYRNKQFTPLKTDSELQAMLDSASGRITSARQSLLKIENPDANLALVTQQLARSVSEAEARIKEQADWLKIYLTKNRSGRRSMFYEKKTTIFGIPVN
jgi:hypothetical protein